MENVDFSLDVWKKADIITVFVCLCLFSVDKRKVFFRKCGKIPKIRKESFKKMLTRSWVDDKIKKSLGCDRVNGL